MTASASFNLQIRKFDITKYESSIKKDPSYEGIGKVKIFMLNNIM